MYSIGLDISKSTINVYIPISDLDIVINNDLKSLKSLYSKLKKLYKKDISKLVFVYEPTGSYSFILTKYCSNQEIKCFIVNPKKSSNFAKAIGQRNKNDILDARMLSKMLITANNSDIKVPIVNITVEEIKVLINYYKLLTKQKTQNKNHLEALKFKDTDLFVIKKLKKEIKHLQIEEQEIIEKIKTIIKKDKHLNDSYEYIQTIKSVGELSAIVLLYHFIQYPNTNERQIVSLSGLDPVVKESGTSIKGRKKISKAGSKICRSILFMSALNATQHNQELKAFYNNLKENGKHSTLAQIAVMRKIIILAFSLYKKQEVYNPEKYLDYKSKHE